MQHISNRVTNTMKILEDIKTPLLNRGQRFSGISILKHSLIFWLGEIKQVDQKNPCAQNYSQNVFITVSIISLYSHVLPKSILKSLVPTSSWKRLKWSKQNEINFWKQIWNRYLLQTYYSLFLEFFFHLEPLILLSSSLFSFFLAFYKHTFFLLLVLDRHTPTKRRMVCQRCLRGFRIFILQKIKFNFLFKFINDLRKLSSVTINTEPLPMKQL